MLKPATRLEDDNDVGQVVFESRGQMVKVFDQTIPQLDAALPDLTQKFLAVGRMRSKDHVKPGSA